MLGTSVPQRLLEGDLKFTHALFWFFFLLHVRLLPSLNSLILSSTVFGSAGEYQADEQAGVARLSWRVSGR